jgi:uncharacterized protein (TIGR03437 family)
MTHFAVVAGIAFALLVPARAAVPADPAGWQVLFSEDFEHGDGAWNSWGDTLTDPIWAVEDDAGSAVYSASSHTMTVASAGPWRDSRFHLRVKVISGQLHLYFRHMNCGSYFATLDGGPISLTRMVGCPANYTNLQTAPTVFSRGVWHVVDAVTVGASIKLYLDGALALDYVDSDPVLLGGIGLEALADPHVHVDDVVVTGPVDTQSLSWVRTGGPQGGVGYDIRMRPGNPDTLLVTDNASGVSISTDGGRNWTPSNAGITSRAGNSGDAIPVFCLTVDPNNPDTVWVGTQNMRGIYKSTDGGKTWTQKDRGVVEKNGITFRGFTVDPKNSSVVYAAAQISSTSWAGELRTGRMFDLSKGVVYRTVDGGESWTAVWRGDSLARYIWIDPRDSKVLYVSTGIMDAEAANSDPIAGRPGGVGILKSTDGGASWRVLNEANGLKNLYVGSLFMHPSNPDILLAGTGNAVYNYYQGVYLSTDGGATWRLTMDRAYLAGGPLRPDSGDQITAVEFAASDPRIAYAASGQAFYRSDDGGVTWRVMAGSPQAPGFGPPGMQNGIPMDLQVDPRSPNRVFVNNYTGGNLLTEDGGLTWQLADRGYTGADLHDIAIDPTDSRRVFTIGRSGVYRSDDAGATWTGLNYPAGTQGALREWYGVAVDPRDPRKVLFADEMTGILLLSNEAGLNWRVVFRQPDVDGNTYGKRHGFKALAFAPSDASVIYAGMCADRVRLQNFPDQTSFGVYKSTDGGETWLAANDFHTAQQNINMLAVDPRNANTVYAGTVTGGVLRTQDGGRTWTPLNVGLHGADVRALAIDTRTPAVMYAGVENGGLYKSIDTGAHWQIASAGMDPGATVRDIVIDATNSQVLYAADLHTGVYRSADGGNLWVQVSKGLSTRAVTALSLSSDGGTLYAGTEGGGVFRLDVRPDAATTVSCASAASYVAGAALAAESIAAGFGKGLAAADQTAGVTPLPITLGGVSVSVTDSAGIDRPAPLFFVSAGQINFEVPAGTAAGQAAVRVLQQNQVVARGSVNVDAVAPGLFTANADGKGVSAAVALRVAPDGGQSLLDVYRCGTALGSCAPVPIDLGGAANQMILELFGTGIRGRSALTAVTAKIGGQDAEVMYAGPQGGFAGLDQVNVRVPRSLAGRGDVDVVLVVDGKTANTVTVNIL